MTGNTCWSDMIHILLLKKRIVYSVEKFSRNRTFKCFVIGPSSRAVTPKNQREFFVACWGILFVESLKKMNTLLYFLDIVRFLWKILNDQMAVFLFGGYIWWIIFWQKSMTDSPTFILSLAFFSYIFVYQLLVDALFNYFYSVDYSTIFSWSIVSISINQNFSGIGLWPFVLLQNFLSRPFLLVFCHIECF